MSLRLPSILLGVALMFLGLACGPQESDTASAPEDTSVKPSSGVGTPTCDVCRAAERVGLHLTPAFRVGQTRCSWQPDFLLRWRKPGQPEGQPPDQRQDLQVCLHLIQPLDQPVDPLLRQQRCLPPPDLHLDLQADQQVVQQAAPQWFLLHHQR